MATPELQKTKDGGYAPATVKLQFLEVPFIEAKGKFCGQNTRIMENQRRGVRPCDRLF